MALLVAILYVICNTSNSNIIYDCSSGINSSNTIWLYVIMILMYRHTHIQSHTHTHTCTYAHVYMVLYVCVYGYDSYGGSTTSSPTIHSEKHLHLC